MNQKSRQKAPFVEKDFYKLLNNRKMTFSGIPPPPPPRVVKSKNNATV